MSANEISSELHENYCQKKNKCQRDSPIFLPRFFKNSNQNSNQKAFLVFFFSFKYQLITHCECVKHAAANYIIKRSLKKLWVRIWPMEPNTWAFLVRYMSGKLNTSQHCKSYFMHRKKSPDDWHSIPCLLANNLDPIYICGLRFSI